MRFIHMPLILIIFLFHRNRKEAVSNVGLIGQSAIRRDHRSNATKQTINQQNLTNYRVSSSLNIAGRSLHCSGLRF
jgi:hypothetical protein